MQNIFNGLFFPSLILFILLYKYIFVQYYKVKSRAMDFKDQVVQLSDNIKNKRQDSYRRSYKNAFIMPMIAALGYDVLTLLRSCLKWIVT